MKVFTARFQQIFYLCEIEEVEFATWDGTIYDSGYLGKLNALLGLARAA